MFDFAQKNIHIAIALTAISVGTLSACGGGSSAKKQYLATANTASVANKVTTTVAQEPQLKQKNTVNVGDVMYSEFSYQTGMAAQTKAEFDKVILFGSVKMPAGTVMQFMPDYSYTTYCTLDKVYYGMSSQTASEVACFEDENKDGEFDRVQVKGVKVGTWTDTDGPAYSMTPLKRKSTARTELLYQGRIENSIKVGYREINAQGEETASQTVEYTLSSGGKTTEVGFKKARLVIEAADNNGITYQVVKGFAG